MTSSLHDLEPHFYVPEIFGPTVQGEGLLVGTLCHFIRFGGCDYHCSWCDSLHAVDSAEFTKAPKLTAVEIIDRVLKLPYKPEWVVLSGGNPAVLKLGQVNALLQEEGFNVQVETQGSRWADWLNDVDMVCISPKPPSSGMHNQDRMKELSEFYGNLQRATSPPIFFKVPVLTEEDLEFVCDLADEYPRDDVFVSIVAMQKDTAQVVLERTKKVLEWLTTNYSDVAYRRLRIFPQQHFLLWGHEKGR